MRMARIALLCWACCCSAAQAQDAAAPPRDAALSGPAWSPYVAGALIGVLSWLTFYFSKHPLGASTAYARVAGIVGTCFAGRHTRQLPVYQEKVPRVEWQTMLVGGVIMGALLAAWTGGELTGLAVPPFWEMHIGQAWLPRWGVACLGGAFMALGARIAGGCTSGHGISGALQLSVGSWIALVCFFMGGMATANLLFRL